LYLIWKRDAVFAIKKLKKNSLLNLVQREHVAMSVIRELKRSKKLKKRRDKSLFLNFKMKYILGGGIAGLIWGFYNQDYKIISPETGGQNSAPFQLGPRYLKKNEYTKKFLEDLNLKAKQKKIKVGYYKNNKFVEPDEDFIKKYFEKSRGEKYDEDKTVMNSNKKELLIFDIDFKEIIEKLETKLFLNVIKNCVEFINPKSKELVLRGDKKLKYSELITTMPLNIFHKNLKGNKKDYSFICKPVTYVLLNSNFFNMESFDFIYILGKRFHRITKTEKGLVADCLGEMSKEELKEEFGEHLIDSFCLKNAQIISLKEKPRMKNIVFSGRYGAWNREYKTEQVIEEAIQHAKERS